MIIIITFLITLIRILYFVCAMVKSGLIFIIKMVWNSLSFFSKIKGQKARTYTLYTLIHYSLPAEKKNISMIHCVSTQRRKYQISKISFFVIIRIVSSTCQFLKLNHNNLQCSIFIVCIKNNYLYHHLYFVVYYSKFVVLRIAANHIKIKYLNT
jgi:hypothetical protein